MPGGLGRASLLSHTSSVVAYFLSVNTPNANDANASSASKGSGEAVWGNPCPPWLAADWVPAAFWSEAAPGFEAEDALWSDVALWSSAVPLRCFLVAVWSLLEV